MPERGLYKQHLLPALSDPMDLMTMTLQEAAAQVAVVEMEVSAPSADLSFKENQSTVYGFQYALMTKQYWIF